MIEINKHTDIEYYTALAVRQMDYRVCVHRQWVTDKPWPPELPILRHVSFSESDMRLVTFPEGLAQVGHNRRKISVEIHADSLTACNGILQQLSEALTPAASRPKKLDVTFWFNTQRGPSSYNRQLDAPDWQSIAANYPDATREAVAKLMTLNPSGKAGKLILWQGAPGVGKTYALRALAEEWKSWCRVHYVVDPEEFFGHGSYLAEVSLGEDEDEGDDEDMRPQRRNKEPWRLIVLEDTGELLSRDAKERTGQALSRLLNLCDGMLGQGLRVILMITTNEEIASLHPAVMRPGRCLSNIVFDQFDPVSAQKWLEQHGITHKVKGRTTLADLYAIVNGSQRANAQAVAGFVG